MLLLLGLVDLGWRRFLVLMMGQPMSEVRLRMRLIYELEVPLVEQLDCQLLVVEAHLVLSQLLELCMSRSIGLHSQYTHSFSIIGGL